MRNFEWFLIDGEVREAEEAQEAREAREADQNRGRRSPANIKYNQRLIKVIIQSYQVLDVS